jgi:surfeit locus 1 family protein
MWIPTPIDPIPFDNVSTPTSEQRTYDWQFARRPFWIFSHIFAGTVIGTFIVLGFWQLARLDARQEQNALVETRLSEVIDLSSAPDGGADGTALEYRSVTATVVFIDEDFVRVGNRSQGGVAGEHVVAIAELMDGSLLAVNRGFVPANVEIALDPLPSGPTEVSGWLRATVTRASIGATDNGEGVILPRLDTERVGVRLGEPLPTVWLQIAPDDETGLLSFPDPVPLPPLDDGPHRSYAVQWFTFATLGVAFYGALVYRQATGDSRVAVTAQPIEP